ncbi:MAG: hypothetical protein KatS3mg016_1385 [Fimbriimonadales bacterium]|nr:MAG: hypothetical protein KatS3mg016_1385 [Fimbriimonadales bacterium]
MWKQRWWILLALVGGVLIGWIVINRSGRETIQPCDEYSFYPSPDGKYILLGNPQTGQVALYATAPEKVIKWFDNDYRIPTVGGGIWSQDSKRFLLVSEEKPAFIVVEIDTLLERYKSVPDSSLKALLSPDGEKVVAEIEDGVLLWNVNNDEIDKIELSLEQIVDLSTITWVNSQTILLMFGYSSPRLVLYDLETSQSREVPPTAKRITASPYATAEGQVPVLISSAEPQSVGLLDIKTHTLRAVLSLPGRTAEFDKWVLLPYRQYSSSNFVVLSRYLEQQRKSEVIRVDLQSGKIVGQAYLNSPFGVDASGRVWQCQQGHLTKTVHLADNQ